MAGMGERERALREERANVWNRNTALIEKMHKGERLTVEERSEYDAGDARLDEIEGDLGRIKKYNEQERAAQEVADERGVSRDEMEGRQDEYESAFTTYLKRGASSLTQEQRSALDSSALQTAGAGVSTAGAYLIPQGFWQNLQIALKAYGGLLQCVNVVPTATGNPMPWPTNDPTAIVGSYITEGNQLSMQDYTFGQGMMFAWTITSGIILASQQIIEDSAFDVNQFITDRAGEAIGRKIAQELHTGAGSGSKALTGIHTANAALGTPRVFQAAHAESVYTLGSGTDGVSALDNGLISFTSIAGMVHSVDPAYRAGAHNQGRDMGQGKAAPGGCQWVMNDHALTNLRSVTDSLGRPLWQPNVQTGEADGLWGFPYVVDQNMPDVSTSTSTVGGLWFGDFKRALVVRQVNGAHAMRLTERYADYLQVGFLVFVRLDSQPNDMRAVVEYETEAGS
jgi:HK97 family phage major capsid protein